MQAMLASHAAAHRQSSEISLREWQRPLRTTVGATRAPGTKSPRLSPDVPPELKNPTAKYIYYAGRKEAPLLTLSRLGKRGGFWDAEICELP